MNKIKKEELGSADEDVEKLKPSASGNVKCCSHLEPAWQFLKELNIELTYNPAIPLLGIYPREIKICPHKNLYTNTQSSIIYNSQKVEINVHRLMSA